MMMMMLDQRTGIRAGYAIGGAEKNLGPGWVASLKAYINLPFYGSNAVMGPYIVTRYASKGVVKNKS